MKDFSGITLILFAMALNGKLEISIKNNDYAFKQTDKGRKEAEAIIATKEGKAFWNELDRRNGGKHQL